LGTGYPRVRIVRDCGAAIEGLTFTDRFPHPGGSWAHKIWAMNLDLVHPWAICVANEHLRLANVWDEKCFMSHLHIFDSYFYFKIVMISSVGCGAGVRPGEDRGEDGRSS
jgi:hypothetical protein